MAQKPSNQQDLEKVIDRLERKSMTKSSRLRSSSELEFTREDVVSNAKKNLGYGIVATIVGLILVAIIFVIREAMLETCGCFIGPATIIFIGITLLGIGWTIWSAFKLITAPARRVRGAECPFCKKNNHALKGVKQFPCQQCGRLLVLGGEDEQILKATECPHCHRPMGVAGEARLQCLDCGVLLHWDEGKELTIETGDFETCSKCGQSMPSRAFFCSHCGNILPRGVVPVLREPGKKEMILRSEVGNLRYSTGALQGLWPKAVDGRYGGGAHPQSSLMGITQLFRRLTLVVDGFEDALHDSGLKDEVAKQLPLLNQTYGALLLKLHAELLAQKDDLISASNARPFLDFDGANKYIPIYQSRDSYEWVTAQHVLIQRMEGIQDETMRQWNKDLIKWSGDHKKDDVWLVKAIDITPLLEEAQANAPDIVERSKSEEWFV